MKKDYECVLITGATSGIGFTYLTSLAPLSKKVVLVSRDKKKMEAIAKKYSSIWQCDFHVIPCDLAKAEGTIAIKKYLEKNHLFVDLLINNAGFGLYQMFDKQPLAEIHAQIQILINSYIDLMYFLIPSMKEQGRGKIINIISFSAFFSGPYMSVYFASKNFILSLSQAISAELWGSPVSIHSVCPGVVKTPFLDKTKIDLPAAKSHMITAEYLVDYSLKQIAKGHKIIIPKFRYKVVYFLSKIFPREIILRGTYYFLSPNRLSLFKVYFYPRNWFKKVQ